MFSSRNSPLNAKDFVRLLLSAGMMLLLSATTLHVGTVSAQTPPPPGPGASDPMKHPGNYLLFRNDELVLAGQPAFTNDAGNNSAAAYFETKYSANPTGSTLTGLEATAGKFPNFAIGRYTNKRIVGSSGRILRQDADQAVLFKLKDFQPGSGNPYRGLLTYQLQIFDNGGFANPSTTLYEYSFPGVVAGVEDHIGVAVGDLDRLRDSNNEYQDEVVTVSSSGNNFSQDPGNNTIQLTVFNFRNGASAPQVTSIDTGIHIGYYVDPADNCTVACDQVNKGGQISVALGDFDGDGQLEIAVSAITNGGWVTVGVYRYTATLGENGALQVQIVRAWTNAQDASANPLPGVSQAGYEYAQLAAGDFDDDGKDDLAIGWVGSDGNAWLHVYAFDNNLQISPLIASINLGAANNGVTDILDSGACANGAYCLAEQVLDEKLTQPGWVQIKAGLFHWDPDNGYGTRRRQLAVLYGNSRPVVGILEVNPQSGALQWLGNAAGLKNLGSGSGGPYDLDFTAGSFYFVGYKSLTLRPDVRESYSLMAGKFGGYDSQDPVWHLGVSAPFIAGNVFQFEDTDPRTGATFLYDRLDYGLEVWKYDPTCCISHTASVKTALTFSRNTMASKGMAAVALDLDGKSLRLGAPVHMVVEDVLTTFVLLQEPPKHAYYDKASGQVVTVSRYDEFNVSMVDSKATTFSSQDKSGTDWSIGGSLEASAGLTLKEGIPDLTSTKESLQVTAKVGYDYDAQHEKYNSNYSSQTVTITGQTEHDDLVRGQYETLDIWRYRIYGTTVTDANGKTTNGFYDLVLPAGDPQSFGPISASQFDWYQPVHENGNILSYPQASQGTFTPSDVGTYFIPCTSESDASCVPCDVKTDPACTLFDDGRTLTNPITAPLLPASEQAFDGTSDSQSLDTTSQTGSGGTFSYSHTLAESLDVKASYKFGVGNDSTGVSFNASAEVTFNNSNSWSGVRTHESTTTASTGITLSKPSGDASESYIFYPVFYTAQDGTIKVSHAVSNPADPVSNPTGYTFWADLYGRKPDPALNLPLRFSPKYSEDTGKLTGWEPNLKISRKLMRGFFLRKSSLNPVTGDYDYLTDNPVAGDQVRIDARVYNYSTNKPFSNLKVRFQAIPYDSGQDQEGSFSSCPDGAPPSGGRCTIGETFVSLDPLQWTTATVVWDTTGFAPATAGALAQYRIYVVLDPDNTIDEIYETEAPGTVDGGQNNEGWRLASVAHPSLGAAPQAGLTADVYLKVGSLAALDERRNEIRTKNTQAYVNRPLSLRATVYSDRAHRGIGHLLVYDGDPDKGGTVIAGKLVNTGEPNGSNVWFEWTPRTIGPHRLFARILERKGDARRGNNTDELKVEAIPAPPRKGG